MNESREPDELLPLYMGCQARIKMLHTYVVEEEEYRMEWAAYDSSIWEHNR